MTEQRLKRKQNILRLILGLVIISTFLVGSFVRSVIAVNITGSTVVNEHFDSSIPGYDICKELRHLTEPQEDPTLSPPREVFKYTVSSSEDDSGGVIGGGDTDSVVTQEGSIFQKWFLDACVMDGYLTEVRHVATIHNFDVRNSDIFQSQMGNNEGTLGELFEIALMEVTKNKTWMTEGAGSLRNLSLKDFLLELTHEETMQVEKDKEWMEEDISSLEKSSMKDFLLELTHESTMEATEGYDDDKNEELTKASIKDFLLYVKDSNEQFMTDLMQALSEKEKLHIRSLKEYELAKIEKAREDVNKLTYEVYNELKEEPLVYNNNGVTGDIVRSLGLRVVEEESSSCPFGVIIKNSSGEEECVIIKREGRVIQNVDDYIYEEAIQKARDFVMCFLAPWRHFPIGEDYYFAASFEEFKSVQDHNDKLRDGTSPDYIWTGDPVCGEEATAEIRNNACNTECGDDSTRIDKWKSSNYGEINDCRECIREELDNKCDTEYICEKAREEAGDRPDMFSDDFEDYLKKLCPSDQIKEQIKRDLLFDMARKYKFLYNAPPENWYYNSGASGNANDKTKCALILANLGYDVDGIVEEEIGNPLRSNMIKKYAEYQEDVWRTELPISVAYRPDVSNKDYNKQNAALTSSTGEGVKSFAQNLVDEIISDYESLRTAEYIAGEGIRSEKYLIGFPAYDDVGDALGVYFIDTENIISPAIFLKDKIAAATQAQFDLAQNAWKQKPEGIGVGELGCPDPHIGEMDKSDFSDKKPYTALENKCTNEELEHGWYLVEISDPGTPEDEKEYECRWPQYNDITCEVFGYITTEAITDELPKELPAPWEDINEYMEVPEEYVTWFEGDVNGVSGEQLGLKKAPPAFDIPEYGTQYPDLTADDIYPNIYQEAYGKDQSLSMPNSDKYYINKWYKNITQLYEKPMSEILRTWFKENP
jgi:hypothetical protein